MQLCQLLNFISIYAVSKTLQNVSKAAS